MKAVAKEIPWTQPPEALFAGLCDRAGAFLLDSALEAGGLGRFSIMGFEPYRVFRVEAHQAADAAGGGTQADPAAALIELRRLLAQRRCASLPGIPFPGGAVGYFSYEFGASLEKVNSSVVGDAGRPLLEFGFHDGVVVHDRREHRAWLVANSAAGRSADEVFGRLENALAGAAANGSVRSARRHSEAGGVTSTLGKAAYLEAVARIKAYIASGDVYQVNLTHRFEAPLRCHPYDLFMKLRGRSPAPFACYLNHGGWQVVGSSPERFLRITGDRVETRPIKGTRPRGRTAAEDARLKAELAASAKDRAELLMIVDLERNDLGRVCVPGSIRVDDLNRVETHPTVHHLVANVSGQLRPGTDVLDCVRAMLPGGSITGAPKVRSMQIIGELETTRRGVYTGAVGYMGFDGGCDFNIAIRTIVCAGGLAQYHVGGGIVWDSDPESEHQETLDKGAAMRAALLDQS